MKYFKYIVFSLIPLFVLLGIAELISRFGPSSPFRFAQQTQNVYAFKAQHLKGYFKGIPGQYIHEHIGHDGEKRRIPYTINELGFRSAEFSPKKPRGTYRIVAMGGSSVMGVESPYERTWPALLQQKMGSKFEVINAGIAGHHSSFFVPLALELLTYEPDLIILYAAYNDTFYENQIIRYSTRNSRNWLLRLHGHLYGRSGFYTRLVERVSIWKTGSPVPWFEYVDRYKERHRENIEELIELLKARGVRLVFVLQPLRKGGYHDARHRNLLKQLESLGKQRGVEVLDPRPLFNNPKLDRPSFHDVVHLTEEGNELLAQFLAEQLPQRFPGLRSSR